MAWMTCLAGWVILSSWGFFAHKEINQLAIYALPTELMGFYKMHTAYLKEHAVDPDKRRYSVEEEAARHYLDADYYEQALPLDTIPRKWLDAVALFTEDTLKAYGIGPWHLEKMCFRLTQAFLNKDIQQVLKVSAEVGHYAGDLCVPLHSTMNYNGQLSGQKGIHGFWESRLPELFYGQYQLYVGKAFYVENINSLIWEVFEESHAALDSVLQFEKELDRSFKEERKYAFEEKGNGITKVYSKEYSQAYHERLNGMVERRMKRAIHLVASLWYTAWVNAGSPDLPGATPIAISVEQESSKEQNIPSRSCED